MLDHWLIVYHVFQTPAKMIHSRFPEGGNQRAPGAMKEIPAHVIKLSAKEVLREEYSCCPRAVYSTTVAQYSYDGPRSMQS